ncbi:MAG TPA: class I SAM-dependent RNA methyltransferase [Thermomicrobiales bacterium]|nr:class I SAM-dependent RNA methyltransferase [Thermomicrobiales bacterium]
MNTEVRKTAVIEIERIVAGGYGLGRHDGRVLLVPLTAPGDTIEVVLPERGAKATLNRIIVASPERVTTPCPYFGICGGCDLMHLSYPAQVEAKVQMVVETIERIGGQDLLNMSGGMGVEANPEPLHSRIRATWQPTPSHSAGYFRRGSHDVIEIDFCPILDPALESVRAGLRIHDKAQGLTNGSDVSLTTEGETADVIEFTVADAHILGSADVFFQASTSLLDRFVRHVVHLAGHGRPKHVLELYSGIGLFSVPLAPHVGTVDAVESAPLAVELARQNVQRNCLRNVECHVDSAEQWIATAGRVGTRPDAILVDPPRVGLSDRVAGGIIRLHPQRIVYVSCDPATFARDARLIADAGYRMTSLTMFDLFPQTHHTETVAAFERVESAPDQTA